MTPPIKTFFGKTASAVGSLLKGGLRQAGKSGAVKDPEGMAYDTQMLDWVTNNQGTATRNPSALPYKVLKQLARTLPLVGVCKNTLKHEVTKIRWDLVPIDKNKVDPTHIDKVFNLLSHPNRNRESFRSLMDKVVDDLLDIDAGVLEKIRNRQGEIAELWHRDSATIVPLYDQHGVAGDPAYVQIIEPHPDPIASWSNEDMIYMSMNPQGSLERFGSGMSPVETAIASITSMLMVENYNTTYFNKNTIPPAIINLGEDYTDAQIKKFRSMWISTLQGGNNQWNNPIVGSKTLDVKLLRNSNSDMQFMEYTLYLMKIIVAAFEMSPQDIGFTMDINRANGEVQSNISKNKGLMSMLSLIREYINNEIIYDFGYQREFTFEWMDIDKEDESVQAEIDKTYMAAGIISGNEIRIKRGYQPIVGLEKPFVMTKDGPVYFDATPLEEVSDGDIKALRVVEDESNDEQENEPPEPKDTDTDQGNIDGADGKKRPEEKEKSLPVQKAKKKVPRISVALHSKQEKIEQGIQATFQDKYRQLADYYLKRLIKSQGDDPSDNDIQDHIDKRTGDVLFSFFLIPSKDYADVYSLGEKTHAHSIKLTEADLKAIEKQRQTTARDVGERRVEGIKNIIAKEDLTNDEKKQKVENYLGVDEDQPNYTIPSQMYAMSEMQWALNTGILAGIKALGNVEKVNIVNSEGPCPEICQPLIAKNPWSLEEVPLPQFHVFCRCVISPV